MRNYQERPRPASVFTLFWRPATPQQRRAEKNRDTRAQVIETILTIESWLASSFIDNDKEDPSIASKARRRCRTLSFSSVP